MASSDGWSSLARSLIGEAELTSVDVAAQAGVEMEQARRLWRALGFPPVAEDARVFTASDVAILRAVRGLLAQQDDGFDVIVQLTRVTGQSLARVAEAQVAASADRLEVVRAASAAGAPPPEVVAAGIGAVLVDLEPFLGYVWRRHLLAALMRLSAGGDGAAGPGRVLAIGFADLVGFTAISQQLTEHELAAMVDRFEAVAYEHIPERGGRVVKMIGDEVLFAAADAPAAAEIALALVDAYAGDETLPEVRVGMAIGPTLSWEGDVFGPTVNLASRLVNLARPSTVLIAEDMAAQLADRPAFALRPLRPLVLKGIGRARFAVLRRAGAAPKGRKPGRPARS